MLDNVVKGCKTCLCWPWSAQVCLTVCTPCLSHVLTYSMFTLPCSISFQRRLDSPTRALFSALLDPRYERRFTTTIWQWVHVSGRGLAHEARALSPSPICHSTSTFRLISLADVENISAGSGARKPPPTHTHTHTNAPSLGLFWNILQVNLRLMPPRPLRPLVIIHRLWPSARMDHSIHQLH